MEKVAQYTLQWFNVFLLLKDFWHATLCLLAKVVLMSFLRLLTIIFYHLRIVIMLAIDKNVAFKFLPFLELTCSSEFKTKPSTKSFVSVSSSESVSSAGIVWRICLKGRKGTNHSIGKSNTTLIKQPRFGNLSQSLPIVNMKISSADSDLAPKL